MLRTLLATLFLTIAPLAASAQAASDIPALAHVPDRSTFHVAPPDIPSAPAPQTRPAPPVSTRPAPQWIPTYREPDVFSSTLVGFGVGFGAGAGLAAANADRGTKPQNAVLGGLILGFISGFIGYRFPFIHHTDHFQP